MQNYLHHSLTGWNLVSSDLTGHKQLTSPGKR